MPVQRFAPMTKNFATFDGDAHVAELPPIWERAKDFPTQPSWPETVMARAAKQSRYAGRSA
jgi:hypothetical protein